MTKGNTPLAVVREQNLTVTAWQNGKYTSVTVDKSYPDKETKDLPKGHEDKKYKHVKVSVDAHQLDVLVKLLLQVKDVLEKKE